MSAAKYGIDTPNRLAFFIANVAHESGRFSRNRENLNYSTRGLLVTFPGYFTPEEAEDYARQPERIANRVYANRMGNGSEESGDGWVYRGGGLIQLTGMTNYLLCGMAIDVGLLCRPDLISVPYNSAMSAGWYWNENRLSRWADADDFDGCCDMINRGHKTVAVGDSNGYADRLALLQRWRQSVNTLGTLRV